MHFPIGSEIENGLQAMFDTVVVLMSLTTIMIAVWYILWGCQDFSKNPESMCTKKGMPTKQATSAMSKPHSVIDIAAVEGQKGDCEAKGHVPYVFTSIEVTDLDHSSGLVEFRSSRLAECLILHLAGLPQS